MNLQLLIDLLFAVSAAAKLPEVGADAVARWTSLAGDVLRSGQDVDRRLKELKASVEQMVAENRAPTPQEWADLRNRSDSAHDVIQNWSEGGTTPEPEPDPPSPEPGDGLIAQVMVAESGMPGVLGASVGAFGDIQQGSIPIERIVSAEEGTPQLELSLAGLLTPDAELPFRAVVVTMGLTPVRFEVANAQRDGELLVWEGGGSRWTSVDLGQVRAVEFIV